MNTKTCHMCKQSLPIDQFHKNRRCKDGLAQRCKACSSEFNRNNAARKALMQEAGRNYKQNNKDKVREAARKYSQENRAENLARNREWYARHREEQVARVTAYLKANPETYRLASARRRARKANAEGSHTSAEWQALVARYDGACVHCGRKPPEVQITRDHIIPLSKGGSDYISNIQPLCRSCNLHKHARLDSGIGQQTA